MSKEDRYGIAHKMDSVQGIDQIFFFYTAAGVDGIDKIIVLKEPQRQERFIRSLPYFFDVNKNRLPGFLVFHGSPRCPKQVCNAYLLRRHRVKRFGKEQSHEAERILLPKTISESELGIYVQVCS